MAIPRGNSFLVLIVLPVLVLEGLALMALESGTKGARPLRKAKPKTVPAEKAPPTPSPKPPPPKPTARPKATPTATAPRKSSTKPKREEPKTKAPPPVARLAKELSLTPQQQRQVESIWRKQREGVIRLKGKTDRNAKAARRKLHQEFMAGMRKALTPKQFQQFMQLGRSRKNKTKPKQQRGR